MHFAVFYSWQSDLPAKGNRYFIEEALRRAATKLKQDLDIEPVIDRDTAGVGGAPNISETIFSKIEAADIVVADVSIIAAKARRKTPNPNVLFELGYAVHALGPERVLMVMNTVNGSPEKLPFDLRGRRVVQYALSPGADAETIRVQRERLSDALRHQLREIIEGLIAVRAEGAAQERAEAEGASRARIEEAKGHLVAWAQESRTRFAQVAREVLPAEQSPSPNPTGLDLPARFRHGFYAFAYGLPDLEHELSLPELMRYIEGSAIELTGWPFFDAWSNASRPEVRPRIGRREIEQFGAIPEEPEAYQSDYWRASSSGLFYIARRYREDRNREADENVGRIVVTEPTRNTAEALAHAGRLARAIVGPSATVLFRVMFEGLKGRRLGAWDGYDPPYNRNTALEHYDELILTTADEIERDASGLVHRALAPMYASFNLYELSVEAVRHAIAALAKDRWDRVGLAPIT